MWFVLILQLLFLRERERGERNRLKILKITHFSVFKYETFSVFALKDGPVS